jgi:Hereditary spastic paraplegia protein strumpellin
LRLSEHIPPIFEGGPEARRFDKIIFDFKYLKNTDLHETTIEESTEVLFVLFFSSFFFSFLLLLIPLFSLYSLSYPPQLLDMDHEFKESNFEILHRFYLLFESVWKYVQEITRYFNEVFLFSLLSESSRNLLFSSLLEIFSSRNLLFSKSSLLEIFSSRNLLFSEIFSSRKSSFLKISSSRNLLFPSRGNFWTKLLTERVIGRESSRKNKRKRG